jgi:DNA-directed RNA polymerase alpha subunit
MEEENKINEVENVVENEEVLDETPVEEVVEEKPVEDLTAKRDAKCEPIAAEIIQIIAKHKPTGAQKNQEDLFEAFNPMVKEINAYLKESDANIGDVNYIWTIVQAMIDSAKGLSINTVQQAFESAQKKLFAVDNMGDLSLQEIDNVLK